MNLTASEFVASLYGKKEEDLSVGEDSEEPLLYGPAVRLRKQLWEKISIRGDDVNSAFADLVGERCFFVHKRVTFKNAEFSHSTWIKALKNIDGYKEDKNLKFFNRLNCWLINHLRFKYFLSWYCLIFVSFCYLVCLAGILDLNGASAYWVSLNSISLILFMLIASFILALAVLLWIENRKLKPVGKYAGRGKDLALARRLIFQEMSSDVKLRDSDIACNFFKAMENEMHPAIADVDPETVIELEKEVKESHESIAALSKEKEKLENEIRTLRESEENSRTKCTEAQNELKKSKTFTLNSCMLLLALLEILKTVSDIKESSLWIAFKDRAEQIKERTGNHGLRDSTIAHLIPEVRKKVEGQSFDPSWYRINPKANAATWPPVQRSKPAARVLSTE